jgi:hypothetical protein
MSALRNACHSGAEAALTRGAGGFLLNHKLTCVAYQKVDGPAKRFIIFRQPFFRERAVTC